jgi:hypothetical protein
MNDCQITVAMGEYEWSNLFCHSVNVIPGKHIKKAFRRKTGQLSQLLIE